MFAILNKSCRYDTYYLGTRLEDDKIAEEGFNKQKSKPRYRLRRMESELYADVSPDDAASR